jgi:dTDP-4-amino-4,6-dideoxygalactose transaminase
LTGIRFQEVPGQCCSTWNYFTIFVRAGEAAMDCETLKNALAGRGIQSKRYFYPAIHHQTLFASLRTRYDGKLPVAERASSEGLALPLYSHMSDVEMLRVCAVVQELLA